MAKVWFTLALVFLIGSIALLIVLLRSLENDSQASFFESLVCDSEETFIHVEGPYSEATRTSTDVYYCELGGNQRDVTFQVVSIVGVAFAVPLLFSIMCFFFGGRVMVKNRLQALNTAMSQVSGTDDSQI